MESPLTVLKPTKSNLKNILNFVLWVVITTLLLFAIYWFIFKPKFKMSEVRVLISKEAAKYENSLSVEKILLQGVMEIAYNYSLMEQAKLFSDANNVPIERVLVDNAIAMAKEFNYIKPILTVTQAA